MGEPLFETIQVLCCRNPYRRIFTPGPCGTFKCDGFTEYPGNPVYNPYPASSAYYQTVRYDQELFAPYGSMAFYKMWYDRASSGGISLATSPDGIDWTFLADMTHLQETARHSRVLFDRDGFGIGAPYRIWYWDSRNIYNSSPTVLNWLRTAYSVNGVDWTGDTNLTQDPTSPLLTTTDGPFHGSYGPADILYFPQNAPVLDPSAPFNNRYVMYYDVTNGSEEQLALAASADGVFWRQEGPLPVLPRGGLGAWDANYACEHAVVLRLSATQYFMLYSGGIKASSEGIGCATSTDGLNWHKYSGNPVFSISDGVAWRSARTYNPWVLMSSQQFNGHGDRVCFKLWLTGAPGANPGDIDIGYGSQ